MNNLTSYQKLFRDGELEQRVKLLLDKLHNCTVCPRHCAINRHQNDKSGYCGTGRLAAVCSYCDHHGEEIPISGITGSGTIFFGNCNLHCVYCQNADISQGKNNIAEFELAPGKLSEIMLHLQNERVCHNINFVSPSHFVPQIIESVFLAAEKGLHIPLVYNTNSYDDLNTLRLLDGIIDIYLPDIKYANNIYAQKYSAARNYVEISRNAIKEMYRQVGLLECDERGIAKKGLLIRHLVLPNDISGSIDCLRWIAKEISPLATVSVMSQYFPSHKASQVPLLSRKIRISEYEKILDELEQLNMVNSFYQELTSPEYYQPHFFEQDHPFEQR